MAGGVSTKLDHKYIERWWAEASDRFFFTSPYSSFHSQTLANSRPLSLTLAVNCNARAEDNTMSKGSSGVQGRRSTVVRATRVGLGGEYGMGFEI